MILTVSITIIVILVIIAVVVFANAENDGTLATAGLVGQIDHPKPGATVSQKIFCSGTILHEPPFGDLVFWLAVEVDGLFWPKEALVAPDPGGHWEQTVYEGGAPGDFAISLWAVNAEGNRRILAWYEHGKRTHDFPGLSNLPGGRRLAQVVGLRLVD